MIAGELYMLSPEQLNAISQDSKGKNKPETSKEPQYIPKQILRAEVTDPHCWIKLCAECMDLFQKPGTPFERDIKHQIDWLNPDAPVKYYKQYRKSQYELYECKRQIDHLQSKGWFKPSISQYNHPILLAKKKIWYIENVYRLLQHKNNPVIN